VGVQDNGAVRESLWTGWHFVPFEDRAHRSPVDFEFLSQLGHQVARPVVLDKFGRLSLGKPSLLLLGYPADPSHRTTDSEGNSSLVVSVEAEQPQQRWTRVESVPAGGHEGTAP
jgi:hypothetical protein